MPRHLTESEWQTSGCPFDMLEHLHTKLDDREFIHFSVACCRRIWPLITDPRSRAVVEATEAALRGDGTWEEVGAVYEKWERACQKNEVEDGAGGNTHEAIKSVCGLGSGHAIQVSMNCGDAAGYAASHPLRLAGAPQTDITGACRAAERAEWAAQCQIIREMFDYRGIPS